VSALVGILEAALAAEDELAEAAEEDVLAMDSKSLFRGVPLVLVSVEAHGIVAARRQVASLSPTQDVFDGGHSSPSFPANGAGAALSESIALRKSMSVGHIPGNSSTAYPAGETNRTE
jgi:hypothetical protein